MKPSIKTTLILALAALSITGTQAAAVGSATDLTISPIKKEPLSANSLITKIRSHELSDLDSERLSQLQIKIDKLQQKISFAKFTITRYQDEVDSLDREVAKADSMYHEDGSKTANDTISNVMPIKRRLNRRIQKLDAELVDLQAEMDRAVVQLQELDKKVFSKPVDNEALPLSDGELFSLMPAKRAQLSEAQKQVRSAAARLESSRASIIEAQARVQQGDIYAERQLHLHKSYAAEHEEDLIKAEANLDKIQREFDQIMAQMKKNRLQLGSL